LVINDREALDVSKKLKKKNLKKVIEDLEVLFVSNMMKW